MKINYWMLLIAIYIGYIFGAAAEKIGTKSIYEYTWISPYELVIVMLSIAFLGYMSHEE